MWSRRRFGRLLLATMASGASPAFAQTLRPVSIGISSASLVAAAPRIAKELGLFEKQGLDARLVVLASASAATQALVGRSVDFALAGPGEILAAQIRGQKLAILGTAYRGLGASLVLSKAAAGKAGIAADAPLTARLKALDGLVIGTANATSSYTLSFKGAAAAVGSTPRFTYLDAGGMAAALESGALQGFIASAPFWTTAVAKGAATLWIAGPRGELPPEHTPASSLSIAALRDVAESDRALVERVVAALSDLARVIDERPGEVKAATAKLFPNLDTPVLDLFFDLEAPAWKLKRLTAADIAHELAFLRATGVAIPGIETLDPASLLLGN
jgi:ABC-type nitrate/sulfonate/bicarbonate transport system substrate-binding protein